MKNLSDITEGRDIATKNYVDTKIANVKVDLPTVEENVLTWTETVSPEINVSLGVTNASIGDIIKVKAVDENGIPTAWEKAEMPTKKKLLQENWVQLGEYDCSLAENQVNTILINKYNGQSFNASKFLIFFENCTILTGNNATAHFSTDKGVYSDFAGLGDMNTVLSIGTTAPTVTMHKMAILEDYNIGTLLRGFSNRTQYAIEDMQGLFTFKKFFPASQLKIQIGGWQTLNSGTIKVWAVIEQ